MNRRERMDGAIAWMARNTVAANLLMFAVLVGGALNTIFVVRHEVFPQIEPDIVSITVPYPGASPEEVENGILLVVERSVRSIDGVKEVQSSAGEGYGSVTVELETGAEKDKVLADVKNAVDRIVTFPLEAERPIVNAPRYRSQAITVLLYGDIDELVLRELGEQTREDLLALPEISYVTLGGTRPFEISVEIPQTTLREHGLTIRQVADKIRRTALEMPAGTVETSAGDVLLRTNERRVVGLEFEDVAVKSTAAGQVVRLGEIAEITDGFAETNAWMRFEGKMAVSVDVYSVGDESPTEVAAATKEFVLGLKDRLPPGVSVSTGIDMASLYAQRLDLLMRNAGIGLVLVLVILGLFLEPRLAFWVTLGIPVSFLGCMLFLPVFDISLNMVSMFAFIVTLGMVVDDAIVVGENAYRYRRMGHKPLEAALMGAKEVAMPVFFSIATTIAAFSPLLFIPGTRGKFMYVIPVVVILVLVFSLVESFFVLPAHLAHVSQRTANKGLLGLQSKFSKAFEFFVNKHFDRWVRFAVRQRWITLAVGICMFLSTIGLATGGIIKFTFWPEEESDWISVSAKLPFGVPVVETENVMNKLIDGAHAVVDKNGGEGISRGIYSVVGDGGSHVTRIYVNLVPTDERPIGSAEFVKLWREEVGELQGVESISFNSSTGGGGKPIDLELSHRDTATLEAAARELAEELSGFDGVKDINAGVESGKTQIDFRLTNVALASGLTVADLASQVRAAYWGAEALRQQRGRSEVRVMVRLPRDEREDLTGVEELIIKTPAGGEMTLREAAIVEYGHSYTAIKRTDGRRTIRVNADLDNSQANITEVLATVNSTVLPKLQQKYTGLSSGVAGRQRSNDEFLEFIKIAYLMALLGIFVLIAIPLRSYLQPLFVVMIAIPFGSIGAILGHYIMGFDLSLMSLMGMVALSGVVVNDSLVLVVAANKFTSSGLSAQDAAVAAAKQRFRPILLTSLTTFGGLTPMILETSVQARVLIPMAISLGFGVLFSTVIILLLVPALFTMIETPRHFWKWLWSDDESTEKADESNEITVSEGVKTAERETE